MAPMPAFNVVYVQNQLVWVIFVVYVIIEFDIAASNLESHMLTHCMAK